MTGVQVGVLVAAILASGLLAGLFYAFSCAVMPGLARTDDATFVRAIRGTNEAILNRWFAVSLNKQVAAAEDSAGEYAEVRATSEARWGRWNIVRTLTSTMAFACLVAVFALGAAP